jgi:hypothetical protein
VAIHQPIRDGLRCDVLANRYVGRDGERTAIAGVRGVGLAVRLVKEDPARAVVGAEQDSWRTRQAPG